MLKKKISNVNQYIEKTKQALKNQKELTKQAESTKKDADELYKKISNIKVNNSRPEKTLLSGNATVGVDIAPGVYSVVDNDRSEDKDSYVFLGFTSRILVEKKMQFIVRINRQLLF
jgi:hypothetical protein